MKTIIEAQPQLAERAAGQIAALLKTRPGARLAFSAGDSALELYRHLAALSAAGQLSLREAVIFAVGEFEGLEPGDARSCRGRLEQALRGSDLRPENLRFPGAAALESYDALIEQAGGLDLAVLDLGWNARIGFNEPATPYDSRCHRQKLAPSSRRELAALFGGEEQVPVCGLTLGIKTLVEAKEILVYATGEEKAKAVYKMLYGRDDSFVPAAFLQLPPNVTVYLDPASAAMLS